MRIQQQGPSHAASLLDHLNRCCQRRQYCDVFHVGNQTDLFTCVPATSTAVFLLELISLANFEKVLTFVYMGGISIDLIDVGVLHELAERLGCELVRACHATFPDLQASVSAVCKVSSVEDLPLDTSMVAAASTAISAASVSTSSACSSSSTCSFLSSVGGPSADAIPAACAPTSSSGEMLAVQVTSVEGSMMDVEMMCLVRVSETTYRLMWHTLTHLGLPVYSGPHVEEIHSFLCLKTIRSSSAFQCQLIVHTTESMKRGGLIGGQGWLGRWSWSSRAGALMYRCTVTYFSTLKLSSHVELHKDQRPWTHDGLQSHTKSPSVFVLGKLLFKINRGCN
ncbi:LOW QUALITY PROTEIN: uncharacterized protein zbtb39 [Xenentodon cancila]